MQPKNSVSPNKSSKHKVLVVDDHPILRKGLVQLINQEADLVVCGEAEEAPKAFAAVATCAPDVAVIDITIRGGNGIELIKNIKASHPNLPILVLSMHDETLYAERALRAGALGYIMKEVATEQVVHGLRRVLKGEIVLSDKMKGRMLQQLATG